MFIGKHRPKGLEQPCCLACNSGSRWFEDIVSFFGSVRLYGADDDHFEQKLKQLRNNHYDAFLEMLPSPSTNKVRRLYAGLTGEDLGMLSVDGPIVSKALSLYGAKLGLALHAECTGETLSSIGKVGVYVFTNKNMIEEDVPKQLFELLPDIRTLSQGQKNVGDQFKYSSRRTIEDGTSAHWVLFGTSLGYQLFVSENLTMSAIPAKSVFRPGCLTTPKPWAIGMGPFDVPTEPG